MKNNLEGARIRKLIRGNLITEEIYQLNCSLIEGILPTDQVKQGEVSNNAVSKESAKK